MRLTELDEIEYKKKWRLEGMGRQQERGMSETKKKKTGIRYSKDEQRLII